MERSHGIGVLSSGCQGDNSASIGNFFRFKSDQPGYRNIVRLHVRHTSSLIPRLGSYL
jgi:hypothetical protein